MWGVIPAAGLGSRIQPLAFSKELLPVGSRMQEGGERPCAVSEYLLERMILGGAEKICFVIAPGKSDIMEYFGASYGGAEIAYVIQPDAAGLCDAIFRARTVVAPGETVLVGLPDTIWFPETALSALPDDPLSFLLFPVDSPELFDAVVLNDDGSVQEIQVKQQNAATNWVWGAFKVPGGTFGELYRLWLDRNRGDEFMGTLVNAYLSQGGRGCGVRAGEAYVDVGTLNGYRAAVRLLAEMAERGTGHVRQPRISTRRAPMLITGDAAEAGAGAR
jgi:glucose-1-phosphate thymidylyltransferase